MDNLRKGKILCTLFTVIGAAGAGIIGFMESEQDRTRRDNLVVDAAENTTLLYLENKELEGKEDEES